MVPKIQGCRLSARLDAGRRPGAASVLHPALTDNLNPPATLRLVPSYKEVRPGKSAAGFFSSFPSIPTNCDNKLRAGVALN